MSNSLLVQNLAAIKLSTACLDKQIDEGMAFKLKAINRLVDDLAHRHNVTEDVAECYRELVNMVKVINNLRALPDKCSADDLITAIAASRPDGV